MNALSVTLVAQESSDSGTTTNNHNHNHNKAIG